MSWDAYAYKHYEDALYSLDNYNPPPHLDLEMRVVFEKANDALKAITGQGGNIVDGEMGSRLHKECLRAATSVSCESDNERGILIWSSQTVQEANSIADWNFDVESLPEDLVYFDREWSEYVKCETRIFLQVCAQNEYAILFSG